MQESIQPWSRLFQCFNNFRFIHFFGSMNLAFLEGSYPPLVLVIIESWAPYYIRKKLAECEIGVSSDTFESLARQILTCSFSRGWEHLYLYCQDMNLLTSFDLVISWYLSLCLLSFCAGVIPSFIVNTFSFKNL